MSEKKGGGPGCLKIGLGVGCVAPVVFIIGVIVVIVVIVALVQQGQQSATEEAIDRNGGYGTVEKPIPVGTWAKFERGQIRATRLVRPADAMVEKFNSFNDEAPSGAEYVLVWFELKCGEEKCTPSIDLDLRLEDENGKAWKEPWVLVLDDDFDNQEALEGASIEGWQGFEFPVDEAIVAIKVKWGNETLYLAAPEPEK